jgi:hypothetical protein
MMRTFYNRLSWWMFIPVVVMGLLAFMDVVTETSNIWLLTIMSLVAVFCTVTSFILWTVFSGNHLLKKFHNSQLLKFFVAYFAAIEVCGTLWNHSAMESLGGFAVLIVFGTIAVMVALSSWILKRFYRNHEEEYRLIRKVNLKVEMEADRAWPVGLSDLYANDFEGVPLNDIEGFIRFFETRGKNREAEKKLTNQVIETAAKYKKR